MSSKSRSANLRPTQTALYQDAKFDLIARFYPILERCAFSSQLDKARLAINDEALQGDRVLLVGEGNGRFLQWLLAHKINGSITVVEKSRVMVRLAKNRVAGLGKGKVGLEFVETDFRLYLADQPFDCIVTHFFLDLFDPSAQRTVIEKLTGLATDNGTWINVDFIPPRTLAGQVLMWMQYTFFWVVSCIEARHCHDETAAAAQNGWIVSETLGFLNGLVLAKRYQKRRR